MMRNTEFFRIITIDIMALQSVYSVNFTDFLKCVHDCGMVRTSEDEGGVQLVRVPSAYRCDSFQLGCGILRILSASACQ